MTCWWIWCRFFVIDCYKNSPEYWRWKGKYIEGERDVLNVLVLVTHAAWIQKCPGTPAKWSLSTSRSSNQVLVSAKISAAVNSLKRRKKSFMGVISESSGDSFASLSFSSCPLSSFLSLASCFLCAVAAFAFLLRSHSYSLGALAGGRKSQVVGFFSKKK